MKKKIKHLTDGKNLRLSGFIAGFTLIAAIAIVATRAAGPNTWLESEMGTLAGQASKVTGDNTASNGGYVKFKLASTSPSQPPALVTGGATWTNIFSDEFSGSSVNATNWNVQNLSNYGSGNNEDHCYMSANTAVSGGVLKLSSKRETISCNGTNPDTGNSTYYFTSGMVTTRQQGGSMKFKYRFGYTEARVRVPRGNIYWPAYWLVSAADGSAPDWPAYGEFDIFEIYGSKPNIAESNFHRTGGNIGARNHCVNNPTSSNCPLDINAPNPLASGGTNNWHTYGFNWTANKLEWYIDGTLVRTYNAASSNDTSAMGYEHSIILNLAMGGNGPRYPDHGYTGNEKGAASGGGSCTTSGGYCDGNLNADIPGTMEVDYVKVWQAP